MTTAAVVASIRYDRFCEFLRRWGGPERQMPWDLTILVQDGGGARWAPPAGDEALWKTLQHHDWASIARDCEGEFPAWLSRRDAGIKCWGFYQAAVHQEADMVIALDDDCLPSGVHDFPVPLGGDPAEIGRRNFVELHAQALASFPAWTSTVPGMRVRGLPYEPCFPAAAIHCRPVVNMGLWEGVPDRDARTSLAMPLPDDWRPASWLYALGGRVMNSYQYWPMSGMNLAFRRAVAPLMYFPRMGEGVPFTRFDDIWAGVIVQKICRHLGLPMKVGGPLVRHDRASDPHVNLTREAPGILCGETFWQVIDRIDLHGDSPWPCLFEISRELTQPSRVRGLCEGLAIPAGLCDYLPQLGQWTGQWCDLFRGVDLG